MPQFNESFWRSAHPLVQSEVPAEHTQIDPAQVVPVGQRTPQPPQLVELDAVSTQPALQSVSGGDWAGQAHALPMQVEPASVHAFPHAPQFAELLEVSTHEPEQSVVVPGHPPTRHEPPKQTSLGLHACSQVPQFITSDIVSTHPATQASSPGAQVHVDPEHVAPAGHASPQPEQFNTSDVVSTHASVQSVAPTAVQPHAPATHEAPGAQTFPNAPQFAASEARSLHVPPASRCQPVGQSHVPEEQVRGSARQLAPHAPQLEGSEDVSVHSVPPHGSVVGSGQGSVPTTAPTVVVPFGIGSVRSTTGAPHASQLRRIRRPSALRIDGRPK